MPPSVLKLAKHSFGELEAGASAVRAGDSGNSGLSARLLPFRHFALFEVESAPGEFKGDDLLPREFFANLSPRRIEV